MAESLSIDDQLLARFAGFSDREALNQLAARHLDFVYACARRQVGDAHLAEDVTQAVFLLLTRKARSIPHGRLVGWLFQSTRYAAANARKVKARREHHEKQAAAQKGESIMPTEPFEVDPTLMVLDDALASLGATDREAIMLRYLQGREIAGVCSALQLSEAACRKRIARAVEKLKQFFNGKGVTTLQAGVVIAVLESAAAQKAPAGLVISCTTALAGGAMPLAVSIAKGAMVMAQLAKMKVVAAAAAVILIFLGGITTLIVTSLPKRQAASPATHTAVKAATSFPRLQFRLVDDTGADPDVDVIPDPDFPDRPPLRVAKQVLLDESAVVQAFAEQDKAQWQVRLRFNPTGSELFGNITSANLHRAVAMLMDGRLLGAPRINSKITSSAVIVTHGMTETQARALADAIESARVAASTQPTTRGN